MWPLFYILPLGNGTLETLDDVGHEAVQLTESVWHAG